MVSRGGVLVRGWREALDFLEEDDEEDFDDFDDDFEDVLGAEECEGCRECDFVGGRILGELPRGGRETVDALEAVDVMVRDVLKAGMRTSLRSNGMMEWEGLRWCFQCSVVMSVGFGFRFADLSMAPGTEGSVCVA